jgi:hypothetical protein
MAEADKLTLRQKLTVWVPHSVLTLMEYKENYWLTNSQMVKYQSMLCKNLHVQLEVVKTLNAATLLRGDNSCSGKLKSWQDSQESSPQRRTNLGLIGRCLVPMSFIWMGSMAYFTRIGLVWDWRRKFSTGQMLEVFWWLHCHIWVTGSHICQGVPWRNPLRTNSSWDYLGPEFLCPQALQHK